MNNWDMDGVILGMLLMEYINRRDGTVRFEPIDEQAAKEYFRMLDDAPSIKNCLYSFPFFQYMLKIIFAH